MKLYFLIPIYNEALNIEQLHRELCSAAVTEDRFFVFSDDGSTDGSQSLLSEYFKDVPHIVLGDGSNHGPGYAFNTGFNWVLENSTSEKDVVITLEADGTSDIRLVQEMLVINQLGYDMILASVYAQGGGFEHTTFLRKLISAIANLLYRFLFNIKVQTLSSFYRTYNISLLRKIKLKYGEIITESGFICMLELLIKAVDTKAKIIEVPMVLASSKRKGASKLKIFKTTLQYFKFLIRVKRKHN